MINQSLTEKGPFVTLPIVLQGTLLDRMLRNCSTSKYMKVYLHFFIRTFFVDCSRQFLPFHLMKKCYSVLRVLDKINIVCKTPTLNGGLN